MNRYGITIKEIRKYKNISQLELADGVRISNTYLSLIENGKKDPSDKLLKEICDFLEIPLYYLLFKSTNIKEIPKAKQKVFKDISPYIDSMFENIFLKE